MRTKAGPLDKLRLAAEIVFVYARVRWLLWRGDLDSALRAVRGAGRGSVPAAHDPCREGRRLGRATARALAPLPVDGRCLMQSLVVVGLLSRRGIDSVLVVAAKPEPAFEAHAWVEHDGEPLLPSGEYGRLVEL